MTRYLTPFAVLVVLAAAAPASATPTASFSINPDPAVRLSPTTFTSTGRCDRSPCTYRWFHGTASSTDEIATTVAQPRTTASFTYVGPPGPRTITLKVRNRRGQQASVTRTFSLVNPSTSPPPPPPPTSPPPSPPSGGLPNAGNTGVPAGRVLAPSGSMTITQAGAVIDGLDITGPVEVRAPNVTIRNSRITSNSMYVVYNWSTNLTIEDSELVDGPDTGQNNCHNGIGDSSFTVRRTEITGCENAANLGGDNITFADNYIHDLDTTGPSHVWGMDPHTDGLQMSPGADNIVVRHNWIDPSPGGNVTAPIIMGVHGSQSNVWIEDNYLDGTGASYALYANRSPSTNVNINRNRMRKGVGGGYTACVRLGVTVTTFNGNVDDVTGAPVSPDNGFDGGCSN